MRGFLATDLRRLERQGEMAVGATQAIPARGDSCLNPLAADPRVGGTNQPIAGIFEICVGTTTLLGCNHDPVSSHPVDCGPTCPDRLAHFDHRGPLGIGTEQGEYLG